MSRNSFVGRSAVLISSAGLILGSWLATAQGTPVKSGAGQPKQGVTSILLPPALKPLLPDAFDGWVQTGKPSLTRDPAQADAPSTAALKEYGFTYAETATYKRDAGETVTMRALRFDDTSGAYGAYSFYRQNGWPKEDIGTGGTSNKNRVLFWKGDTVVDATFSEVGTMTAGGMRQVAAQLPVPTGNRAMAPPILAFLPQANLDHQTTHYAEGPAGYAGGGVLPPGIVDFDKGAEAATADYTLNSGPATLTIIEYPTPQIAEAQEAAIRKYIQAGSQAQPPWPKPLMDSDQASLEVRHSGVLVALVSGDAIPDESHRLLETVHYEADLVKIPQPTVSEVAKTSQLLLGIASIVIIGSSAAILLGFFLGGGRALWRVAHGRPASSVYDEEFIHLDLRIRSQDGSETVWTETSETVWTESSKPSRGPNPKG